MSTKPSLATHYSSARCATIRDDWFYSAQRQRFCDSRRHLARDHWAVFWTDCRAVLLSALSQDVVLGGFAWRRSNAHLLLSLGLSAGAGFDDRPSTTR